jgi:RND family efflux transporter MFP subunit
MRLVSVLAASILACSSASPRAEEYAAVLDWSQRVEIATPVTGVVEDVLVRPGQTVKRNEVLLRLNPRVHEANVLEAKADIDRLGGEASEARRDLDRARELYARTVSSTTELDLAKLRQTRAEALLAAAQARIERARRQLDESSPRAPFDALVLARHAEPGTVTSQCQPTPLLSLARADEILARFEIEAVRAGAIRLDSPAWVSVTGRQVNGAVRALRPGRAGGYLVEIAIPRSSDLVAGLAASVRLP